MECATTILALAVLVALPLAVAAYRKAQASAAGQARLEAELGRVRQALEALAASRGTAIARELAGERHAAAGAASPPVPPMPAAAAPATAVAPTPAVAPRAAAAPLVASAPPPATAARAAMEPPTISASPAAAGPPPPRHGTVEELIGSRVMPWVGALALALAGGYMVKLSFEHGWISPSVRIALGVAFGVGLLAFSQVVRRSTGRIAEALAAAGIADLFASFLAAVHVYHLVPPAAGFALMALTTAVAVVLALRQGAMVALLGLVGGFLTPALVRTAQPSARGLFLYLLLLLAGLIAVARRRRWPWLAFCALAAGLAWAAVWLAGSFHAADGLWLSLFLIALAAAGAAVPGALPGSGNAAPRPTSSGIPGTPGGRPGAAPSLPAATIAAVAGALILLAVTAGSSAYSATECGFLALLTMGVLLLAWLDRRYLALSWFAAGAGAALLIAWGAHLDAIDAHRFLATVASLGALIALAAWAASLAGETRWHRRLAPTDPTAPTAPVAPAGPATGAEPPTSGEAAGAAEPAGAAEARAQAAAAARSAAERPDLSAPGATGSVGPGRASAAALWAALSAATGVGFFLLAWNAARRLDVLSSTGWAEVALVLAALYLAAALPLGRRWRRRREPAGALAAMAVAVTTLVSIAMPLALEGRSLAAAWALEVAALVWLAGRFELPALRGLARLLTAAALLGTLASGAAAAARGQAPVWNDLLYTYGVPLAALAAAGRMALHRRPAPTRPTTPATPTTPTASTTPQGGPRTGPASFSLTDAEGLGDELSWAAVILGFLLLTLEIDQLFQPAATGLPFALFAGPADLALTECAAIAVGWLLLGLALLHANWPGPRQRRLEPPAVHALEQAGHLLVALGLGAALLGSCLIWNPLWSHQAVGSRPLGNLLLAAYALPAALAVAGAAEMRRHFGRRLPAVATAAALLLGFALVTLEVRQLFHGTYLDRPEAGLEAGAAGAAAAPIAAERYAYSAVWIGYGVALLVAGMARRSVALRYAALAVMLLAVLKVFLYDTARLSDLYRVLSFLGLGASLLLLAFLYQRFILHGDEA